MKKNRILIFPGILIIILAVQSCKKEDPSVVGFKMKATETNYIPGLTKSAGNVSELPLNWDTAVIIVNKLEFEAEFKEFTDSSALSMEVKYEWEGNQTIDLLADPGVFATIDLPDGTYEEIELKIVSKDPPDPDMPNFYLAGTLTNGVDVIPVVLVVNDDFTIETEVEDWEINSQQGSIYDGLIELSLQKVFSSISLDDLVAAEQVDGRIVISSETNAGLYERILENLQESGECHPDGGWDGDDDDDDDDDDDGEGD